MLIRKQKNPLVPEIPPADEKDKYLAEKTVENVLQFFGKSLKEARRRYRVFVEKGLQKKAGNCLTAMKECGSYWNNTVK